MSLQKYHILYITRWYPHRADPQLGVFIRKHAKASSSFCRISVLNVRADESSDEKFKMNKYEENNFSETIIHYLPAANRISGFLRFAKAHFIGFESIARSYGKPQLMQLNVMYGLCLITLLLSYKKQIPFIIAEHWHGFIDLKFRNKNFLFKNLFRYTALKAKAIIVVSEFLKKGMLSNGLKSEYFVVPNVVEAIEPKTYPESGAIKMLSVADLDDDIKNISGVIKVYSQLVSEGLTSTEYHIIGGGKDEMKLKKLAGEYAPDGKNIFFHGKQSNDYVLEFLSKIDFVIINSHYETFSVIAAESLMSGKPLVCTRCGGVDDFVDDDCGILINPDSNLELKNAIKLMTENCKKYDSKILHDKVADRFGNLTVGKQLFEIYKKVIDNN